MNNEYRIFNATPIQKRIEELETKRNSEHKKGHDKSALRYENTILELKQILSQSTSLIPEIEKAYTKAFSEGIVFGLHTEYKYKTSEDYISNLKLDI